jgi:hypothetical protein
VDPTTSTPIGIDLYWIPLGAGGRVVRRSGRIYETCVAALERRPRRDLFHTALVVLVPEGRFAIESTPVPDDRGAERGVVAGGPVGTRWAGRFRLFRYEIRCWRDGVIPDIGHAVASPVRVAEGLRVARRVLELAPSVPTPVWGRDELRTGDMWNSNSLVAWLLTRAGVDLTGTHVPPGGRAPGWQAGLAVARRGT